MAEFKIANCPSQELALTNCLFIHPSSFALLGGDTSGDLHCEVKHLVYAVKPSEKVEHGAVGMNSIQRRGVGLSLGDSVILSVFSSGGQGDATLLSSASIEADFVVKKAQRATETLDGGKLVESILKRYEKQYLTTGQSFAIEFMGTNLLLKIGPLESVSLGGKGGSSADGKVMRGLLTSGTQLELAKAQGAQINFTGLESQSRSKTIFSSCGSR